MHNALVSNISLSLLPGKNIFSIKTVLYGLLFALVQTSLVQETEIVKQNKSVIYLKTQISSLLCKKLTELLKTFRFNLLDCQLSLWSSVKLHVDMRWLQLYSQKGPHVIKSHWLVGLPLLFLEMKVRRERQSRFTPSS